MDVITAIQTRHSMKLVRPTPLPRDMIQTLLEAGNAAPNHHKVRPWRFMVLTGAGRERLGDVMAASQRDRKPDLPPEAFDKTRALPLRAPLVIAVGVDKPADARIDQIENISAASAACQNILLAAHSLGLGGYWRTGEWARDPHVKKFLGFAEDQHIVAFLYIGYPDIMPEQHNRPSYEDRTVWME